MIPKHWRPCGNHDILMPCCWEARRQHRFEKEVSINSEGQRCTYSCDPGRVTSSRTCMLASSKWHGRSHQPHSEHGLCLPAAGWAEDGVVDRQTGAKRTPAREPKETRRHTVRAVCFHACEFENRRRRNDAVWNTNKGGRR